MRVNDRHVSFYFASDTDYGSIEIDPKKTALLVVDMQHVFITRPSVQNPGERDLLERKRWEPFYRSFKRLFPASASMLCLPRRSRHGRSCS